jgi:NhaP-type Na+/H+ or K+/H+ antiporter
VTTLLAGFFWLLPLRPVSRLPTGAGSAYELLVTLVFGVAFGAALGVLCRRRRSSTESRLSRRDAALVALAAVGVVAAATGLTNATDVVENLLWVAALGIAAVGYHRTRSAWVAVLALSGFSVALRVIAYAEATLGLATF